MERRELIAAIGWSVGCAGCTEITPGEANSPTDEDQSSKDPHTSSPTDIASETENDCTIPNITIHNSTNEEINVEISLIDSGGPHTTATKNMERSPTETSNTTFEDRVSIEAKMSKEYTNLPDVESSQYLETTVNEQRVAGETVDQKDWEGTNAIYVDINKDKITFSKLEYGLSTRCA